MKPDQLSQTAAFIAIKFYGLTLTEPYRSLFSEETVRFYSRLVKTLPSPLKSYHSVLRNRWLRKFFIFSEELLLPGDLMHILMRKYYIHTMMENLRQRGYEQLVVLGAGFDHLAVMNSQLGIRSYELDVPRMVKLKKNFIQTHAYHNQHLFLEPAWLLNDRLSNILNQLPDFDSTRKTVFVAEGFFDYLTPDQSKTILKDLNGYFENELTLLSTVFSLEELSSFRAIVFKAGVRIVGEQLKLHYSQPEFKEMLQSCGFSISRLVSASDMRTEQLKSIGVKLPVLKGFYLLEAHLTDCQTCAN